MPNEITLAEHFSELARYFHAKAQHEKGSRKAEFERVANCYSQMATNPATLTSASLLPSGDYRMENDSQP